MEMRKLSQVRNRWDADGIRALRLFLDVSQSVFANYLGVRQQTVSEWETGVYRPRGASGTLLTLIAEQAGFRFAGSSPSQYPSPSMPATPGTGGVAPSRPAQTTRTGSEPARDARDVTVSRGYVPYVPPALRPARRAPQNSLNLPRRSEIPF